MFLLPAFNEEARLPAVLRDVGSVADGAPILVVDDGSRDATAAIASAGGAIVLRHPFNLGYGAALQTGYKFALREGVSWLVQMDADGQHHASDVPALLEPLAAGEADLVIGSRFLTPSGYPMGVIKSVGRGALRFIASWFGLEISDPTSGFQAMNASVLRLYSRDFFPSDFPDVDVLLKAQRSGLRIRERPVTMSASSRPSLLHSGLAPLYYAYKMTLVLSLPEDDESNAS